MRDWQVPFPTDQCLYVFFICTDYVGTWPSNANTCYKYYQSCTDYLYREEDDDSPGDNTPEEEYGKKKFLPILAFFSKSPFSNKW